MAYLEQRFVSSTVNMDVILSHLQLIVNGLPILTPKKHKKQTLGFFLLLCTYVTF